MKEIFLYYEESYADTHSFLKMNDFKSIKKFIELNIFDDSIKIVQNNVLEEEQKAEKFESHSKKSPQNEKSEESPEKEHNSNKKLPTSELKIQPLKEGIITKLSKTFLLALFDYFDPLSLTNFGLTCQYLREVSNHNLLYKKFCVILFSPMILLPDLTPFVVIKDYILAHPFEFDQITRNNAVFDIRSLIWGLNNYMDEFRTTKAFYKQFENWKNCFLNAPRICMKGYYLLKEKYLKMGEKDISQTYDPIFVVEYFRYMRFFDHGLVIMAISAYKLTKEKIIKLFKKHLTSEDNEVNLNDNPLGLFNNNNKSKNELKQTIIKGEYMRKEGKIYAKFCSKGSTIFEYELLIKSSQSGKNDLLFVLSRKNKELTSNYVRDDNDQRASGMKVFEFKKVNEFGLDIKDMTFRCVSL